MENNAVLNNISVLSDQDKIYIYIYISIICNPVSHIIVQLPSLIDYFWAESLVFGEKWLLKVLG